MQPNQLFRFVGAAALGVLVAPACGTKQDAVQYVDTAGPGDGTAETTSSVSYMADIAPKLAVCGSCHGNTYATYANAKKNAPGANNAIQSGSMPPPDGWPQATRALFQTWLDEGTPQ